MRARILLVVFILAAASFSTTAAQPAAGPPLRLHRAFLDASPQLSSVSPNAAALRATAAGPYAIIQLRGPIKPEDRAALERTGVRLLEYLPDFAYLVRGDAAQLDAAARLPQVYARVPLALADKLAPALLRALARGDMSAQQVRVIGWPDGGGTLARDLRAAGADGADPLDGAKLMELAALPSVRWIEPVGRPRLLNDAARGIMRVGSAWQGRGLYGAGQIIGIADSGLDTGNPATLSPDFAGRLVATHVLAPGGDLADTFGHGTHVAGSAAGAGVQSGANPAQHRYDGSFAGVAPEAGLVIQAFEADSDGKIIGLPSDYYTIFAQAYADGARLHSDSWGDDPGPLTDPSARFGGYPNGSRRTDQFVWEHPDMAIFVAAGNSGTDGDDFCKGANGVVDSDSLLTPATAKNVITVGASESKRSAGGYSLSPWWDFGRCFNVAPLVSDLISNNPDGMAAFSSRGPVDDGRVKPDIVAPGTNIVSNRSHAPRAGVLWGVYEDNANYAYSGGTSMSAPLTAGAGALVRQWLTTRGITNPSAAALKAALLATAHDMGPGQYGTGAKQEIPSARPNSVEGWGRVDLGFLDAPAPFALWVDDHAAALATGQAVSYASTAAQPLEVLDSAQPLRVLLAWTDPATSLSSSRQLVNDLDLVVRGPDGTPYWGNGVKDGDRINNVEGVVIDHPPVGRYTVEVRAYNVPVASQPYALALAGPVGTPAPALPPAHLTVTKRATPALEVAPGGLITYTLTLTADAPIAQPVALTDTLPLHTTLVTTSAGAQISAATPLVHWMVPTLDSSAGVSHTLVVRVDADAADGTPIVNAEYGASNGVDLPGSGPPVTVTVRRPAPVPNADRRVYVPVAAR